jgi:hypothetical protein
MNNSHDMTATPDASARAQLVDLKRRLTELKLEALRRGYGLETDETAIDDLDTVVADIVRNVERRRRGVGREAEWAPRGAGADHPTSSRA